MKKTTIVIASLLLVAGGAMTSCRSNRQTIVTGTAIGTEETVTKGETAAKAGISGKWYVSSIGDVEAKVSDRNDEWPYIEFGADGRLSGNAGCNLLMGTYKTDGKNIDFGGVGATKMMCADMTVEDALLSALPEITGYDLNTVTGTLRLTDRSGKTLVTLTKVDPRTLIQLRQSL